MGRCRPEDIPCGSRMVHFTCSDLARLSRHTPEGLRAAYAMLGDQAAQVGARLSKSAYGHQETNLGFTYSKYGLLASDMAIVANVPESIYRDWMHIVAASGGVGQFEINQYILRIGKLWPLHILDDFRQLVRFPPSQGHTCKFQDRVVAEPDAHIKAFAAETVPMFVVLGIWTQKMLLEPGTHML